MEWENLRHVTITNILHDKKYEVIPKIVDEFVKAGFAEQKKFFEKEIDLCKEYEHLKGDKISPDEITAQKMQVNQIVLSENICLTSMKLKITKDILL